MNLEDPPAFKKDNRTLFIVLAYVAAACLIFASFSKQWLVNKKSKYHEQGIGLRTSYECAKGDGESHCESISNSKLVEMFSERNKDLQELRNEIGEDPMAQYAAIPKIDDAEASSLFVPMGWATLVECLLGALGLIATATLALRKMRVSWPVMPQSIALLMLMATLITAMLFVAKKPGFVGSYGVGITFWIYGVGAVMGIAAAQGLSKLIRPIDPDLAADAMNPDHY